MPNLFVADSTAAPRQAAPGKTAPRTHRRIGRNGSGPGGLGPSGNGPQGNGPGTPGRGKRRWRPLLFAFLILALVVPASAGAYLHPSDSDSAPASESLIIEDAFPSEPLRIPVPEVPAGEAKAMNILVLGSDSRDMSAVAAARAASGTASNQRSDTMMLIHIPADRSKLYSISLMRDLWVTIPGHGEAKINAALAYGGIPLVIQTVESLLQQRIDQVVRVDFRAFRELVDTLGGVQVDVTVPFTTDRGGKHYEFKAGPNTLNGAQALDFVRERYAFRDGDFQRVRHQQLVLKAVLAKAIDTGALSNPLALRDVLKSLAPFLSMAPGLDSVQAGQLALSLQKLQGKDSVTFTLPTAGTGTSPDGQSIVLPDLAGIEQVKEALSGDRLGDYAAAKNLGNGK